MDRMYIRVLFLVQLGQLLDNKTDRWNPRQNEVAHHSGAFHRYSLETAKACRVVWSYMV